MAKKEDELKATDDRSDVSLAAEVKDVIFHEKSGKTSLSTFAVMRNGDAKLGTMNLMLHVDDGCLGILARVLKEKKITMKTPLIVNIHVPQGDEEKVWRSAVAKNKDEAQTTLDEGD